TEPRNPPGYPDQFRAAGFSIAVRYESRIVTDLGVVRPRAAELSARIAATGIRVRSLTPDRLAEELRALFLLSWEAFARNAYYRSVSWEAFRAHYSALQAWLDPDLVLLAEDPGGRLRGFLFALPDLLN